MIKENVSEGSDEWMMCGGRTGDELSMGTRFAFLAFQSKIV